MSNSARSRFYSSPPSPHSISANYVWSETVVVTGATGPITGAWLPALGGPDGSLNVNISSGINISLSGASFGISSVAVTGGNITINSGSYSPNFVIITNSQTQIPVGAKSWAVSVISGSAYINGVGPIFAYANINGGGYDGRFPLNAAINVGGTGVGSSSSNILVVYET